MILTTSNHRPYTFPAGKIPEKSGAGRDEAVKYSDYAIGKYLAEAKAHGWFNSTLFVFIADHNAAVAGGTKILPEDYRIPFVIYAPKLIKPQLIERMGSQIDVAPTLLGLLNLNYESAFFGHDLMKNFGERAFLGTYQKLGYLDKDQLVVLAPVKKSESYNIVKKSAIDWVAEPSKMAPSLKTAISYYQIASLWFRQRISGLENLRR